MLNAESTAHIERTPEEELQVIMDEHESALLRYATRLLNDPSTAQDVVQDVFIRMFRGLRNGSRPTEQIKGWLYRVTHNLAVDYIRRESRLKILHERQAEESPITSPPGQRRELEEKEQRVFALQHLRKLEDREQQVVILRLQEGMSYNEIAEITKLSEGNVGFILHHAVKKLSRSLADAGVIQRVSP